MLFEFFKRIRLKVVERNGVVTINGTEAYKLQEIVPRWLLFEKEEEDLERIKKAVDGVNIYATRHNFEDFLYQVVVVERDTEAFIEHLNKVFKQKTMIISYMEEMLFRVKLNIIKVKTFSSNRTKGLNKFLKLIKKLLNA